MKRLSLSRQRLVEDHLGLVRAEVRRLPNLGLDRDDLEQEGMVALVEAARRYDPKRGLPFSSYGAHLIRQALLKACAERTLVRLPERTISRHRGRFRRARRLWEAAHDGRTLERADLAAFCREHGISERAAFELLFEVAIVPLAGPERRESEG